MTTTEGPTTKSEYKCYSCENNALMHCSSCDIYLCKDCVGKHVMSQLTHQHSISSVEIMTKATKRPICKDHNKQWELQCEECGTPICPLCCTDAHKRHLFKDIEELFKAKKETIEGDIRQAEDGIYPIYHDIISDLEYQIKRYKDECQSLKTDVSKVGDEWHKMVDVVVNKYYSDIDEFKTQAIAILEQHLSDINDTFRKVKDDTVKAKGILNSNDGGLLVNFESKIDEMRKIPRVVQVTPPSFSWTMISQDNLLQQFGTLTSSTTSYKEEYIAEIRVPDTGKDVPSEDETKVNKKSKSSAHDFVSGVSQRTRFYSTPPGTEHHVITRRRYQSYPPILEQYQKRLITTVTTGLENLSIISCLGTEQAWVSQGNSKDIRLFDTNNCCIENVISKSEFSPYDMVVTKQNNLLYCDSDHSIWKVGPKTENVITFPDWSPKGICITSNGELLVCMTFLSVESKVVRYCGSSVIQEIKKSMDRNLYGTQDLYVTENKNSDIWVSDDEAKGLVVTDKLGEFKFIYSHELEPKMFQYFCPRCIDSDSSGHILVIDTGNKCVHVIDDKGQLMFCIGNLSNPRGLSVDAYDRVWICELSGKVKIVNYLRY